MALNGYNRYKEQLEWLKQQVIKNDGEQGNMLVTRLEEESKKWFAQHNQLTEKMQKQRDAEIEKYNEIAGTLTGYDCSICKNRGYIAVPVEDWWGVQRCRCEKVRKALKNTRDSGLENLLQKFSLKTFDQTEPYAKKMYAAGRRFLDNKFAWLYLGGQPGSGKTHLCTGICGELLQSGYEVLYMLWRDDANTLKSFVNTEEYINHIKRYKQAEVLYIDDFWKVGYGEDPLKGDINLAFEIINSRYNTQKRTLISSEFGLEEIIKTDEAIGSRIYERTRAASTAIYIAQDDTKNRRLRRE